MLSYGTRVRRLALSIGSGSWNKDALTARLIRALDGGPPDPVGLAARLMFHFDDVAAPSRVRLIAFLRADEPLFQAFSGAGDSPTDGPVPRLLLDPSVMAPLPARLLTLPLPQLPTCKDLRLWLGLFDHELTWFADRAGRQAGVTEPRLHHYRYRWIAKSAGRQRLIEIPKARLKAVQRQILHQLLDRVPAHPSAHGFRRHHSCLSYVAPHVGKAVVLHMDLRDFFHSVPVPRIGAMFRRLGYPETVAGALQGLCTHAAAPALLGETYRGLPWETRNRLRHKHLPQGAPTSPAVANLCAWRLDCRLQGVAERYGLDYTRYADDLAFSGSADLMRLAPFLQGLVGAVAAEEGFAVNHHKTCLNTRAQRQRLAGIVINRRPNPDRREYDRLKATLYNCVRFGPHSQNRAGHPNFRAHLLGRVAHVAWLNPVRAERLETLLDQIPWGD